MKIRHFSSFEVSMYSLPISVFIIGITTCSFFFQVPYKIFLNNVGYEKQRCNSFRPEFNTFNIFYYLYLDRLIFQRCLIGTLFWHFCWRTYFSYLPQLFLHSTTFIKHICFLSSSAFIFRKHSVMSEIKLIKYQNIKTTLLTSYRRTANKVEKEILNTRSSQFDPFPL